LQVAFELGQFVFGFTDFFHGHFTHVRVAVLEQGLGALQVGLYFQQVLIGEHNGLNFGVFLGISTELGLIGDDLAGRRATQSVLRNGPGARPVC